MALHGNHSVLLKGPGRQRSGSRISDGRSDFNRAGSNRNRFCGWTGAYSRLSAEPRGYAPGSAFVVQQYSGDLGSVNQVLGTGDITPPNLAGGLNGTAPLTASGTVTSGDLRALGVATAGLSGAGDAATGATGLLSALASLTGAATVAADIYAFLACNSATVGSGAITATMDSIISILSDLTGSASVTAALVGGLTAAADLTGSGTPAAAIIGVWHMAVDLTASASVTASLLALAEAVAALSGSVALAAAITAKANVSSDVVVAGELLTTTNVAQAVWTAVADGGFTYAELQKIVAAVQGGKTVVEDHGDGTATVRFRDPSDTRDVVVAEMDGSERVSVTHDP